MKTNLIQVIEKRSLSFTGSHPSELSKREMYENVSYLIMKKLSENFNISKLKTDEAEQKQVFYLSMEFLPGTMLGNSVYNLNLQSELSEALEHFGFTFEEICQVEPDLGLGNGGLGRLASCYLDGLTTQGIVAHGMSICYRDGLFKQVIRNTQQYEEPDKWQDLGDCWLVNKITEAETITYSDFKVLALPRDLYISGYKSELVNSLRLWEAKPIPGECGSKESAYNISKSLYPEDNIDEGKLLRIRQQYFFVSATAQSLIRKHYEHYKTLDNFHEKVAFQINDTHPTLIIPELMRIMIDNYGYTWEKAEHIVRNCVSYTNHTILPEALEKWPIKFFSQILPRILEIIIEFDRRLNLETVSTIGLNKEDQNAMRILQENTIHMANLCVYISHDVNGVSALHTKILKENNFSAFEKLAPGKIHNITNGIAYRRWLCQANPLLSDFIQELIGDTFKKDATNLKLLETYKDDNQVLDRLIQIKKANKERLAKHIHYSNKVSINLDSMFDVQVKRLHEYKRQLLNLIHIMYLYDKLLENPNTDFYPITFIFAAKAYPSDTIGKSIISLAINLAAEIEKSPSVKDRIRIVFMENYSVSMSEMIIPAADLSKQISLAGKEASGTGNMKLMINGAVTMGTKDGSTVEISELVGDENIYIFGMREHQVKALKSSGVYNPWNYINASSELKHIIDTLNQGINNNSFSNVATSITTGYGGPADQYYVLADFEDYRLTHSNIMKDYSRSRVWAKKSLMNIANSGMFSADRAVLEYSNSIWNVNKLED
ncbi:MAG: glycogen/starch/alpha-glucan phosphorylase [Peptostreptococcaceae bacterium]|nr:glycogen/starch/alpha-glucan phosphorylase [Peptostreptococcaceae bacterium]